MFEFDLGRPECLHTVEIGRGMRTFGTYSYHGDLSGKDRE